MKKLTIDIIKNTFGQFSVYVHPDSDLSWQTAIYSESINSDGPFNGGASDFISYTDLEIFLGHPTIKRGLADFLCRQVEIKK